MLFRTSILILLLLSLDIAANGQSAEATYNPATGAMTINVNQVYSWYFESTDFQLTGPDDVVVNGILPTSPGVFVTNNDYRLGESRFDEPLLSYSLDLALVAQPNIPSDRLIGRYVGIFNEPEARFSITYVPESGTIAMLFTGFSLWTAVRRRVVKSIIS